MELIIDNCLLSKKQHRLELNYGPQSGAQHQTFRGRKHIYKIMLTTYSGLEGCIKLVRITFTIQPEQENSVSRNSLIFSQKA
jgi:hypothetical protein